jgi:hypothetical protein
MKGFVAGFMIGMTVGIVVLILLGSVEVRPH